MPLPRQSRKALCSVIRYVDSRFGAAFRREIKEPEQLEPDIHLKRNSASITSQLQGGADNWPPILAFGRGNEFGPSFNVQNPGGALS